MKNKSTNSFPSQVVMGAFVTGLGVLFLLDNLNFFDFRRIISFWPTVILLFGVVKLLDTTSPNGKLFGAILIAIGSLMTINRIGWFHFELGAAWPLVLVVLGSAVIYRALDGRRTIEHGIVKADEGSDEIVDVTAVLGGFDRRVNTQNFRGGEVTAFMGGCMLDLRGASIDGEAVINVFAGMGGISLKVPADWTVILQGTPIIGGFDETTSRPPHSNKRLIVKGYAIMGGVDVRN
jgi:predicted membrane protein